MEKILKDYVESKGYFTNVSFDGPWVVGDIQNRKNVCIASISEIKEEWATGRY